MTSSSVLERSARKVLDFFVCSTLQRQLIASTSPYNDANVRQALFGLLTTLFLRPTPGVSLPAHQVSSLLSAGLQDEHPHVVIACRRHLMAVAVALRPRHAALRSHVPTDSQSLLSSDAAGLQNSRTDTAGDVGADGSAAASAHPARAWSSQPPKSESNLNAGHAETDGNVSKEAANSIVSSAAPHSLAPTEGGGRSQAAEAFNAAAVSTPATAAVVAAVDVQRSVGVRDQQAERLDMSANSSKRAKLQPSSAGTHQPEPLATAGEQLSTTIIDVHQEAPLAKDTPHRVAAAPAVPAAPAATAAVAASSAAAKAAVVSSANDAEGDSDFDDLPDIVEAGPDTDDE